ncbi:hypothetical protein ABVT39_009695 [Epinephelus coioides]
MFSNKPLYRTNHSKKEKSLVGHTKAITCYEDSQVAITSEKKTVYQAVDRILYLNRLKKKETHIKLHGYTLSEYWRNIPQGPRIQKAPIGKQNEDFNKKWCEILNKCSMDLMLLITEEVSRQKEDALKDISNHQALMREKMGDDFNNVIDSIKHTLKTYEDGLMATKIKKYKRDTLDYIQGKVYKWAPGRRPSTFPHQQPSEPL